ncbi:S9 family peptidase, partial [bacterium]|nr:S9 family peptidase [bacterium]
GLDGKLVMLVDKLEHPDRGIDKILVSPDGKKVAYSTTLSASDQHVWYVKSIEEQSRHLINDPLLVRMDGFSWGQNSNIVYFSHFGKIEDVIAKKAPIHTIRSMDLKTGKIRDVFNHNEHANFAVFDVDGGNTLLAHRILGPGSGIKALLSVYKGQKQRDGSYSWSPLIAPNSTIGNFLGVISKNGESYALMHTDQFGKKYGIAEIPLSAKSPGVGLSSVVDPQKRLVLHNSQMHQGKLFLEYFDPVNLRSSMYVADAATGVVEKVIRFSDYGVLNNGALSLPVSFNGPEVTFKYTDVLGNVRVFSYNLAKKSVEALKNPQSNPFNTANVRVAVESFKSQDGTTIRGLKMYPVDAAGNPVKPKFFFMKSYGMIGIKYVAEPLEAQLVLQRGGVYFVPEVRGGAGPDSNWQVQGARDFNLRYQDMMAAATYITQKDPMYVQYKFDPKKDLIALGRSYNGAGILNVAARYPEMAKMFVSVVPLWDPSRSLNEQPFGVIAHSDYFPNVNPKTGELILDAD